MSHLIACVDFAFLRSQSSKIVEDRKDFLASDTHSNSSYYVDACIMNNKCKQTNKPITIVQLIDMDSAIKIIYYL